MKSNETILYYSRAADANEFPTTRELTAQEIMGLIKELINKLKTAEIALDAALKEYAVVRQHEDASHNYINLYGAGFDVLKKIRS